MKWRCKCVTVSVVLTSDETRLLSRVMPCDSRGCLADEWTSCIISQRASWKTKHKWKNSLSLRLFVQILSSLGVWNCLLSSLNTNLSEVEAFLIVITLRREIIKHGAHILQVLLPLNIVGRRGWWSWNTINISPQSQICWYRGIWGAAGGAGAGV